MADCLIFSSSLGNLSNMGTLCDEWINMGWGGDDSLLLFFFFLSKGLLTYGKDITK